MAGIAGLSLAGIVLAAGLGLLVGTAARQSRDATFVRLIFIVGILLACLLPFGWSALTGRSAP